MGMFSRKKADEWLDWLSDERPDETVRAEVAAKKAAKKPQQPTVIVHPSAAVSDHDRRERLRRAGQYSQPALPQQPKKGSDAAISININLPKVSWGKYAKYKPTRAQLRYWSAFSVSVLVVAIGLRAVVGTIHKPSGTDKQVEGASTTTRANPSFKPLVPEKKPELATPNGKSAQYDGKRDLYTFGDNFSGANMVISQQPMPEVLKKDPAKVLQLTDSIGAKSKVTTAYGVAYFGVDEKSKALRGVLLNVNQSRLVFFQSDKPFDADSIKFYLESLR